MWLIQFKIFTKAARCYMGYLIQLTNANCWSWSLSCLSCMVGFCHWHIPTFIITDIFPPWWDFVMVGICWVTIMIMSISTKVSWGKGTYLCVKPFPPPATGCFLSFTSMYQRTSCTLVYHTMHQWYIVPHHHYVSHSHCTTPPPCSTQCTTPM